MTSPSQATDATKQALAAAAAHLPLDDTQDFDDAARGFIAKSEQRQITATDGRVVWDLDAYAFLDGPAPDTANPSLWRQGQLLIKDGLFEVVPGIYQARGYDLSVISFIEGDIGVIVIDPLISKETAAAAFALYQQHRGERPVTGMIYTHSHIDHFGGVKGVITVDDVESGRVPVIAPEGFMDYAVSENVFVGTAMSRRAGYMYGAAVEKGQAGQIGAGLGQTTSTGEPTLIPPIVDIATTGEELTVDGVRIVFQVTPGTEAPAEMNFYFPDFRALCTAENTSHTLHNILTLRGAEVRDARAWAAYLTETIDLWGDELEVVFASHHWPTWGQERAVEFLAMQRDMYAYLHDQTLRLINQGYLGAEIAEQLEMPPALVAAWHTHGYYGSVSHNVKAIYQRYLGWYDGNPAHLWQHPPEAAAERYVRLIGGVGATIAKAREFSEQGDLRFAAELASHAVFAAPDDDDARELLATVLERLGFGSECATWRNCFLTGAQELRAKTIEHTELSSAGLAPALTITQLFDSIAIRINGPKAWGERLSIGWHLTDVHENYRMELSNGALIHYPTTGNQAADLTVTLTKPQLLQLLATARPEGIDISGNPAVLGRLMSLIDNPDPDFAIVTP